MSRTVVFIHGMWEKSRSWECWSARFRTHGYEWHAPDWPLHEGAPAFRRNPPAGLGELGLEEVEQYAMPESRNVLPVHVPG